MTPCSLPRPSGWVASALLTLVCLSAACSHTEPFTNPPNGSDAPFDAGPPARLTLNPGHDRYPSWLPDGSALLYSAEQPGRQDLDLCLAELPPTGGRQRRLLCDLPGGPASTDAIQSVAAAEDGRLAALSAANALGGTSPVSVAIVVASGLDASNLETVRRLPSAPSQGATQEYAGHLRWATPDLLVYVGQLFRLFNPCGSPLCQRDTITAGTEVTLLDLSGSAATGTAVPGTAGATGVTPAEGGEAILYTLPSDSRIYRRAIATGDVGVAYDFAAAGVVRDVHAAGTRVAAVVGGRVGFTVDPGLGPTQWDSGGVLHVIDLDDGSDVVLDTPDRLYRRPALSPDGAALAAEGYPLVILDPPGPAPPDTLVSRSSDLYLFGTSR
jgi:hypothetical protein